MPSDPAAAPRRFLEAEPTHERLWRAMRRNMAAWSVRRARATNGEIHHAHGALWLRSPLDDGHGELIVNSPTTLAADHQIDAMLDWYRQRPFSAVLCWDYSTAPVTALAAPLLARGFEPNWHPHWMWLDLRRITPDRAPDVDGIKITIDAPVRFVPHIPYSSSSPADADLLNTLITRRPKRVWSIEAHRAGRTVGRCLLNLTTGDLGLAGLYSMGVVPKERGHGIGGLLVRATAELAQRLGAHHVVLNATTLGEPVYRRLGFTSLGHGTTWLLRPAALAAPRPTADQIALAEAIACNDLPALDALWQRNITPADLPTLPSGLTLIELAVILQQHRAATWLTAHGAPLDLLSAWDSGWRDRAQALLAADPALANAQRGPDHLTPLHIAVDRDDTDLARLILAANPDLTLQDTLYDGTALTWAHHLHRTTLTALIEAHQAHPTT